MSANAHYFRLGLFVLIALALIVVSVIVLGAGALSRKGPIIETYFDESVKGLDIGSPVKYRGVQIGKVHFVGFATEKYQPKDDEELIRFGQWVLVQIEIDPDIAPSMGRDEIDFALLQKRVDAGLRLRLSTSLTGPTQLEADYLDPTLYPVPDLPWEPKQPYVPSAPGTMAVAASAVERLAGQIEQLEIGVLFDNIDALVLGLNNTNARLGSLLNDPRITNTLAQLESASAELPALAGRLNSISVQVDELLQSEDMARIRAGLARTADNTGPTVVQLRKIVTRLDTILAAGEPEIESILHSLQKAIANINALAEDARLNPSRVLFGQPPPERSIAP